MTLGSLLAGHLDEADADHRAAVHLLQHEACGQAGTRGQHEEEMQHRHVDNRRFGRVVVIVLLSQDLAKEWWFYAQKSTVIVQNRAWEIAAMKRSLGQALGQALENWEAEEWGGKKIGRAAAGGGKGCGRRAGLHRGVAVGGAALVDGPDREVLAARGLADRGHEVSSTRPQRTRGALIYWCQAVCVWGGGSMRGEWRAAAGLQLLQCDTAPLLLWRESGWCEVGEGEGVCLFSEITLVPPVEHSRTSDWQ